LKLNTAQ